MANKSVYQEYNEDALKHFNIQNTTNYGILASNGNVESTMVTQDVTSYNKILGLIKNPTKLQTTLTKALVNCKKAFVLPKATVSLDRIKEACKEHNITITNNYELADILITHNAINGEFQSAEKIKTTTLMYKLWNYEAYSDTLGKLVKVDAHPTPVIYDDKWLDRGVRTWSLYNGIALYDEWVIPGLALNLAYLVDIGSLQVVDVEEILMASSNTTELTVELVDDITSLIDSYNDENLAIAAKILPTIDYTQKKHLLWQLAQRIGHKMYQFKRDKDVSYWYKKSELRMLEKFNAQEMILHLESINELNSESFKYLEPIVRSEIRIHNRDLYVFKVSVKEEYKKYLR